MHSSCAVETPPLVFAPPVLVHGRILLAAVEVSITPLPLRSTHWPFSTSPIWTTLLPARLVAQTLPFWSTVVRDGSRGCPFGDVKYSPMIWPVSVLILTTVPFEETATQMNLKLRIVSSSCNWSAGVVLRLMRLPRL